MAVSDGQRANEQTFNDAFLSRTENSDTVAVVGLNHPTSGGLITNIQQTINTNIVNIAQNSSDISVLYATKQNISEKDQALGYAGLDINGKIAVGALPTSVVTAEGNWNGSTNSPILIDGTGDLGQFYIVSVAGTQDLGSGPQDFQVGDWVLYNSLNIWTKIINSTSVQSVNGQSGVVSLALNDITDVDLITIAPVSGNALVFDGTDWVAGEGGGGGGGSKNFIESSSSKLENNIGSWLTDDGSGGAAIFFTLTQETIAPLAGGGSLKVTKSANDATGEFVKLNTETIDLTDRGKALFGSFSFDATHANFSSGDLILEAFDVTNSAVLYSGQPSNLEITKTKGRFNFVVYSETTTAQIQLRIKANSVNALAYDVFFDEFEIGPSAQLSAPIIKPWTVFTPIYNWSATSSANAAYKRIGDSIIISLRINITSAPGNALVFTLPNGWQIDTTKIPTSTSQMNFGTSFYHDSSTTANNTSGHATYNSATTLFFIRDGGTTVNQTSPFTWASGDWVTWTSAPIPIIDLSDGGLVGTNELNFQTIRVRCSNTAGGAVSTVIPFSFTETEDTSGSWNGTEYTAFKSGIVTFSGSITLSATSTLTIRLYVNDIYIKDTAQGAAATTLHPFSGSIYLEKNDVLSIRPGAAVTQSVNAQGNWLEIISHPDYTVLGAVSNFEILQSRSSDKALGTTAHWANVSGNSLPLTPGVWKLNGSVVLTATGTIATWTNLFVKYAIENGTDTAADPLPITFPAITAEGVLTNIGGWLSGTQSQRVNNSVSTSRYYKSNLGESIIRVTSNKTVYVVPQLQFTAAGTGTVFRVEISAERIS